MTWVKLDDNFPDHPKITGLSDQAFRSFVSGICYASRLLTDGEIPKSVVAKIATGKVRDELVAVGLWHETDDSNGVTNGVTNVVIHDWDNHNRPAKTIKKEREESAKRQKKWREERMRTDMPNGLSKRQETNSNGVTNGVSNAVTNTVPSHPIPPKTNKAPEREAIEEGASTNGSGKFSVEEMVALVSEGLSQ